MIRQLTVIGVGLIGGSFALALRQAGAVERIVGVARDPETLERALQRGIIDHGTTDVREGARGSDVVMISVPLSGMAGVFEALDGAVADGAVITDAGSAKGQVLADAEAAFGRIPPRFVAGHPIAGTESSGVDAAFATLYQQHRVILTPTETTDPDALTTVRGLWQATGAQVVTMEAAHHDEVLAATSHLPHVLAYALVDALSRWDERTEIFEFAAGGFRDFTRIASSDPRMWRDICLANRVELADALRRYLADLTRVTAHLEAGDGDALEAVFRNAQDQRQRFLELLEGRQQS